jgi:D-glycero-D-manno-heptose 1,7-bisphosphate phosphatase
MTVDLELELAGRLHQLTPQRLPYSGSIKLFNTGSIHQPPAVFVDRDGVINLNRQNHVLDWEDFEFEEGALEALRLLHQAGNQVFVVTNQAAIGRGLASAAQIERLHERMLEEIQYAGGQVQAVLYCPHLPSDKCQCRKPRPGLLLHAAELYGLQLSHSWLIGDYITDIQAGIAANSRPVLVLTGRGRETLHILRNSQPPGQPVARLSDMTIARNFLEATRYILAAERLSQAVPL